MVAREVLHLEHLRGELETLSDTNRNQGNRDYIKRLNYPRQTYAFTGIDNGDAPASADRVRNKLEIFGAPMNITPVPPGAHGGPSSLWPQVYGASLDCIMSIFDGSTLESNIKKYDESDNPYAPLQGVPLNEVHLKTIFSVKNSNLYEPIKNIQQVKFVVSQDNIDDARSAVTTSGLNSIRSLCMRGPMHLSGWGRTVTMRPTDPLPVDKRENDDTHKMDRSTWETGPVDLRWDSRNKTWRAFNDLIADDDRRGLGTFVHSTNQDEKFGFPFLRGKLEDVWSVRKIYAPPSPLGGPNGINVASAVSNDYDKSATVCTKTDSFLFQGLGGGRTQTKEFVGRLSRVFEIWEGCGGLQPLPVIGQGNKLGVVGNETTHPGDVAIRTDVNFFQGPKNLYVGPISFLPLPADTEKLLLGDMYYTKPGGKACFGWRPGVFLDICKAAKGEMKIILDNDTNLQNGLDRLATAVGDTQDRIKEGLDYLEENSRNDRTLAIDSVLSSLGKIEAWADIVAGTQSVFGPPTRQDWECSAITRKDATAQIKAACEEVYGNLATHFQAAINDIYNKFNDQLQFTFGLNKDLCECGVDWVFVINYVKLPPKLNLKEVQQKRLPDLNLEPEAIVAQAVGDKAIEIADGVARVAEQFEHPEPITTKIKNPCPPNGITTKTTQVFFPL